MPSSSAPSGWALAGLSLSMLMSSLDTSIANAALPALARAFGAPFQHVQWVVLASLLALTTLTVSAGRLGDAVGRRRLLLAGLATFTAASCVSGLAPTLPVLLAARAAQGLGAAAMMALAVALVGDVIPAEKTGRAMGLLGTMSAVGTTLGPSLGGLLTAQFGWQAIFLVNVPIGVVTLLLVSRHLPVDQPASTRQAGFDGRGTWLLAGTLAAYALAMTLGRGDWGALNTGLVLLALGGGVMFLLAQARSASPLIDVAAFRSLPVGRGLAASALVSTVMMATLVVGPFHLSRALGLSAGLVGLALSAGPLVAALSGIPAGRMVDRFGARRVAIAGLFGLAAGAAVLSVTSGGGGVPGYLAPLAAMTASYALFQAANNTLLMTDTGQERRGVVSGLLNLSRNLGLITGASVMGAVFAWAAGAGDITVAPPAAIAAGTRTTFAIAAAVLVVALAVVAGRRDAARRGLPSVTSLAS